VHLYLEALRLEAALSHRERFASDWVTAMWQRERLTPHGVSQAYRRAKRHRDRLRGLLYRAMRRSDRRGKAVRRAA